MKCKNCENETIKGFLKVEQGFVCFHETTNENDKIKDLDLKLIYVYKCLNCGKIEFFSK